MIHRNHISLLIMSYGQIDRQTDRHDAIDKVYEIETPLCCPCPKYFVYNLIRGGARQCTNNLTRMTTSIKA